MSTTKSLDVQIGLQIGQTGCQATRASMCATAQLAEAQNYASVWVLDRVLAPTAPRTPYPASPDGSLPPESRAVLDPLGVLSALSTSTSRVRLGASVLIAPLYAPVLLARALATIDVLSDGRLTVGLGLGWSIDEYEAVGLPLRELGERLEESLDVLAVMWGPDPVSYEGRHVRIAPSVVGAKPVAPSGPPVLLAAYTPAGLDRIARRADGWTPAGVPIEAIAPMWSHVRGAAAGYGRDPEALQLVVRANAMMTASPLGPERPAYHGNFCQIVDDIRATGSAGADEVVVWLTGDPTLEQSLDFYGRLSVALGLVS